VAVVKLSQVAQLGFVVVAALAVYGFVSTARDAEGRRACGALCALKPNYAARNRLAPDFELLNMTGGRTRLSEYRGKVVILNFWTKTCQPCLEEMPSLAELGKLLHGRRDIALVTVTTDDSPEDARATMKSVLGGDPPFAVLIDPEGKFVNDRFGTKLYPETWFIDADGIIRARFDGARDWAEPVVIDLAESLRAPLSCEVEFLRAQPRGAQAPLCDGFSS
jgi:thiol-disulfide isomerase/thioredoxin